MQVVNLPPIRQTKVPLGALLVLAALASCNRLTSVQNSPTEKAPTEKAATNPSRAVPQSTIRAPRFRVYKSKINELTSVVVPVNTTDAQLTSLLWLFREKVRTYKFKDIGITQPTDMKHGHKSYSEGLIQVYRGEKCANEDFLSDFAGPGPCGQGAHHAAYYQWGVEGDDNTSDPNNDSGGIVSPDGKTTEIFNYRDHWQPPPHAAKQR